MNTPIDHLQAVARHCASLCRAIDSARQSFTEDHAIRNHPEKREWEDELTALVPSLPKMLNKLAALEKRISKAQA